MKLIGGQIVEQHIEKIVLAVAMVIFLLVLAMQFLYEPNLVKVGNGPPQPPDKAFVQVEREARALDGKLRSAKTPELDEEAKQRLQQTLSRLEGFDHVLAQAVSPRPVLKASMGKVAHVEGGESTEKLTGNPVAMVSVPAPAATVAYSHRATIDPREVIDHPELRQVLPPEQPYDMTAVSVGVMFDGKALRAKLMEDPDGPEGEVRPMPSVWWRNATEILAVEGEREELGPDGRWVNRISLDPMPGRERVVGKIDEGVKRFEDLAPVVAEAQLRKKEIQRPAFYKQIAGPEWVEPADAVVGGELDEAQLEINKVLDKIKTVKLTIRRTEKAIELAGQRSRDIASRPTGRGGEGGGGGGKGGGGGAGGRPGRTKDTSKDKSRSKVATLERKIEQLNVQLQDLMDQAREMGHVFEGDRMAGRMPTDERDPSDYLPLFENDQVKLWMHDLEVEPGKTYRYRMRVVLNNPAFGRQAYLIDDQKALAEKPTLAGEWSAWTEPVEVLPDTCFFVTSASEGTGLSGPRANVSMYKFYYGYWREASSMLEPGDTLLARAKLPEKGLWIWDEQKLAQGAEEKQDRGPRGGGGGGGRGVIPPERGGGRGVAPGVGRGRDVPPVRTKDKAENLEDEVPEGAEPGPKALELSLKLFLLDVARVPGEGSRSGSLGTSSRARYQAFLGGAPSGILRRLPDDDKATSLYQLVKASADLGRTQGVAKLEKVEEEEDVYIPGMRSPRDDQSGDAGGGGTGGG